MNLGQWINTAVSGLVALCALAFIINYHRLAPWRGSGVGWYVMAFAATIGLLATYTVVITAIGIDGTAATVLRIIRACLLLTVASLLIQATRTMRRAQQPGDR
ncbi:putative phage holin [Streptomyces sp. NPDC004376]